MRRRLLVLAIALAVAAGVGFVSLRNVGAQLAAMQACEAAEAGRWQEALALSEDRVGSDETGRAAAECRCRALLASGRGQECTDDLEALLAAPETRGWAPSPELSVHLIQTLRDAGRSADAARIAERAARAHPDDPDLFYLELATRSGVDDEARVLAELAERAAPRGPAAVRMRVSLANRHLLRGDAQAALAALGSDPPPDAGAAAGLWFETRGMAFAAAADLAGVDATYARWQARGGDPRELAARYALTLSIGKLEGPEPSLALLERAVANGPYDPKLEEALIVRLVLGLALNQRSEEALAAYDRGRERFALEGLTREELLRSAAHRRLREAGGDAPPARLRFRTTRPVEGARLLVSAPEDAPVDAAFVAAEPLRDGSWQVERRPAEAPVRWVLRDAQAAVIASGTRSPAAGEDTRIDVEPREPRRAEPPKLARLAGDGRRRVALLLLDCADWRILQYLRARGELPVMDALLARGRRAVLDSDPPLTAAALEALVWPGRGAATSFVGLVHQLGLELAGLSSIGDNPFGALAWLLPESPSLFEVIGAGPHTAANLLFAHGGIAAGRHGELTGPHGRTRQVELGSAARDLSAAERESFPALAAVRREGDAIHLRTIAAEFDSAEAILEAREVDLLALRIEALDILTHAHFAATTRDSQDDGEGLLFAVYRYIDARLGALHQRLDADDVLIVMSDHGIRTAMEHAREAIFVADGAGIAPGRSAGSPALAGVAHAVAGLLGVSNDWPDTGVLAPHASVAAAR